MAAADLFAEFRRHGGRLAAARRAFPRAPEPWLDLSTGINPVPWQGPRADLSALTRLPDPEALRSLEAVAAKAFGARPECVVAVSGAEAAIRLLPAVLGASRVAIDGPTYSGHEQAWRAAGAQIVALGEPAAGAVIVNPNNPDGRRRTQTEIAALAGALASAGEWLVVDESFVETTPELSVAGAGLPRTVVLRSFGKFYGLPGVRLGFAVASPDLARTLRGRLGDWPLSADAIALGAGAYADLAWAERTRLNLEAEAARLDDLLARTGFQVLGGTSLFRLARAADAHLRFLALAERGVLVRPFDHDPSWLRFGLPKPQEWSRLTAALEACAP